jgi:hypothetical protein
VREATQRACMDGPFGGRANQPPKRAGLRGGEGSPFTRVSTPSQDTWWHAGRASPQVLVGGARPHLAAPYDQGHFFEPTVLSGATIDMWVGAPGFRHHVIVWAG